MKQPELKYALYEKCRDGENRLIGAVEDFQQLYELASLFEAEATYEVRYTVLPLMAGSIPDTDLTSYDIYDLIPEK